MQFELLERLVVAAQHAMTAPMQADAGELAELGLAVSAHCGKPVEERGAVDCEHLLLANALQLQLHFLIRGEDARARKVGQVIGVLLPAVHADLLEATRHMRP